MRVPNADDLLRAIGNAPRDPKAKNQPGIRVEYTVWGTRGFHRVKSLVLALVGRRLLEAMDDGEGTLTVILTKKGAEFLRPPVPAPAQ